MARADRRRAQRTKAPAPVSRAGGGSSRKSGTPSIEDTMFFPKLRRHAKWMFVLLALVFGLGGEVGSLAAGKQADLTVVSLAASPFLPWEDPAAAAVFGGSPERVLATLVAGETRYERGGMAWHELTDAARSARKRLLP